jgi:hypothetical protein
MKRLFQVCGFGLVLLAVALGGSGRDALIGTAMADSSDYDEPPIYITFNVHFDPVLSHHDTWQEREDNLLWLKAFVEGYSGVYQPKLNLQVQGDQAEFYLDPDDPEAAEGRAALSALYEAGHTFGTHMHNTVRGSAPHSWRVIWGDATPAQSVESWQDHIEWVERLYATITGVDDPEFLQQMNASAATILPSGLEAHWQAFAGTYSDPATGERVPHGFGIQTGGYNETFYCLFDHDVQNPWRPGTRGPLDEDFTNKAFVLIPGMPPLGDVGYHGPSACYEDNSLSSRQRMFLQIFLERLYREYTGAEEMIWTFGWHEHLFDLYPAGFAEQSGAEPTPGHPINEFREEVQKMVDWLNERFIGRTTANGNLIAQYATMTQVRDAFLAWEREHPGTSSFELKRYSSDWENYPYKLKGLARELANAHYVEALLPPDSTLQVYRFERCPSALRGETQGYWALGTDGALGCYDEASRDGQAIGSPLPTTTVYVAWRDAATPELTDLTAYVGSNARIYDGVSGEELEADLQAYPLDFHPVILIPESDTMASASASTWASRSNAKSESEDVPPLYFFYAIHTHVQGDWLPYADPEMTRLDTKVAENMLAAIEGIAEVLEKYGAKGTWEVVFGAAQGLCTYQGEDHIFRRLLEAGHEVGVHAHGNAYIEPAFRNLQEYCGVTAKTTSGFMGEVHRAGAEGAQEAVSEAIEIALSLGMTVGTSNFAPLDPRNPLGALCGDEFGEDNDMWQETGNLMFPWKPDYVHRNVCAHDPEGEMVLVDHVGPWWLKLLGQPMPDVLTDTHFEQLREMFDVALQYMEERRPQRVAAWGFVTHITEYAVGNRGENPPDPEALAALDRFLTYVAEKAAEGRVVFATASEIAEVYQASEGSSR